ncbi:MAG: hypothetical protein AAFY51_02085 [Pseudomonadota bacterium]
MRAVPRFHPAALCFLELALMTIRFAPAHSRLPARSRGPVCAPIARALASRAVERVANDDGPSPVARALNDQILRAALRHFAEHGLGAARAARVQAEAALSAGDTQSFDWWIGITRTLDKQMAEDAERAACALAE